MRNISGEFLQRHQCDLNALLLLLLLFVLLNFCFEHILLITMPTIKILFTINSTKKKTIPS